MSNSPHFKVRHRTLGGHVHCNLFVALSPDHTFARSGDFVLQIEEFEAFKKGCPGLNFFEETHHERTP